MKIAKFRMRRLAVVLAAVLGAVGLVISNPNSYEQVFDEVTENASAESSADGISEGGSGSDQSLADGAAGPADGTSGSDVTAGAPLAREVLEQLAIKGRAPKTGYDRAEQFYKSWPTVDGCNLRQRIIRREVGETAQLAEDGCTVIAGEFVEPYTGQHLIFYQKSDFSTGIQIDHIVALSDAWQKGAQQLTAERRYELATDPLNLVAVDSSANQQKSDGDAATWLPKNKGFRCQYIARQISVKYKYELWVTQAEHDAMAQILETCPNERAVGVEL